MKNKHLWSVLILVFVTFYANAQNHTWKSISLKELSTIEKTERVSIPSEYTVFQLDLKGLSNIVQQAPLEDSNPSTHTITSFPDSNGKMERFKIFKAPVMSVALSKKYPQISSYIGKSLEDASTTIRFSITAFGLQAVKYSDKAGITYIDAYTKDQENYIVYNRESLQNHSGINCLVDESYIPNNTDFYPISPKNRAQTAARTFREYRLAMACTIEYAKFHLDQALASGIPLMDEESKKAVVLSAMVATMTRVNFIYERDLSIRMILVDDNDKLIFIDTDEFNNNNANQLISQSQKVIDKTIGNTNYDIGHTVSTGGGGLAQLQTPCNPYTKAMGITGSPNPIGDPFDVDFVAHEMGHQFGAGHTFSSNCNGNIMPDTAVEPGSGSTIMGYAGVCSPNVQANSDPFFHSVSIDQINSFILNRGNCSTNTDKTNTPIIVDAGTNYTIPKSTPFKLTATNPGIETTYFTYSWEQIDKESSVQPPISTNTGGSQFRVFKPTKELVRYFPQFETVLNGTLSTWEVLPSTARTLNFNVIARDNNIELGGQTAIDNTQITVSNTGPFLVTYPNSGKEEWTAKSSQTVTWDVAGTTANGINTNLVNILFSADNGQTFTIIKANTPNDGNEAILVPDYSSNNCRILIEAVGNIYYTVSKEFTITGGATASTENFGLNDFALYPNPTNDLFSIQFESQSTADITVAIHDLRGRLIFNQSYKNTGKFEQEISLGNTQSGIYMITVMDGKNKEVKKILKK
ncbi:reprolysin-like metallopeptidase [Flavobacterium sp. HSC-61S13]|uniref:zinc-dependent metalloprotease n=1 Tax=Flavobacterium sp. HSC-61S13 TaxID=2910963 RepID=UPI0020A183EC|nr:zinc-dependent metalloprotease family protein [Flavobacterium sp. HSC-61S13]MCP1996766.1 hypothetical protein [Flavobacterium sp. HSC-61S13]